MDGADGHRHRSGLWLGCSIRLALAQLGRWIALMPRRPETIFGLPIVEVDDLHVEGELVSSPLTGETLLRGYAEIVRGKYSSTVTWKAHPVDELERGET